MEPSSDSKLSCHHGHRMCGKDWPEEGIGLTLRPQIASAHALGAFVDQNIYKNIWQNETIGGGKKCFIGVKQATSIWEHVTKRCMSHLLQILAIYTSKALFCVLRWIKHCIVLQLYDKKKQNIHFVERMVCRVGEIKLSLGRGGTSALWKRN